MDYVKLTVPELKKLCSQRGIKGYSRLRKAELIAVLQADDAKSSPQLARSMLSNRSVTGSQPTVPFGSVRPISPSRLIRPVSPTRPTSISTPLSPPSLNRSSGSGAIRNPQVIDLLDPAQNWGRQYESTLNSMQYSDLLDGQFNPMPLSQYFQAIQFNPNWLTGSYAPQEGDIIVVGRNAYGIEPLIFVYNHNGRLYVAPSPNYQYLPEEAVSFLRRNNVRTLEDLYNLYGLLPESRDEINPLGYASQGQYVELPDPNNMITNQFYENRG